MKISIPRKNYWNTKDMKVRRRTPSTVTNVIKRLKQETWLWNTGKTLTRQFHMYVLYVVKDSQQKMTLWFTLLQNIIGHQYSPVTYVMKHLSAREAAMNIYNSNIEQSTLMSVHIVG